MRLEVALESTLLVPALQAREWLWADSTGKDGKPTFVSVPTCYDFPRFIFISEKSRPEIESRWRCSRTFWLFFEKGPLTCKFSKMFSDRIHGDIDPHLVCKSGEIWPKWSRWNRALLTRQKEISARGPALTSGQIAPKSVRASSRQCTRSATNFIQIWLLPAEL